VFIRKHPVTADHRREISIRDLADMVIKISRNQALKIEFINAYEPGLRQSGHFNLDKIKAIGWQPSVAPETGFERLYRYFLSAI